MLPWCITDVHHWISFTISANAWDRLACCRTALCGGNCVQQSSLKSLARISTRFNSGVACIHEDGFPGVTASLIQYDTEWSSEGPKHWSAYRIYVTSTLCWCRQHLTSISCEWYVCENTDLSARELEKMSVPQGVHYSIKPGITCMHPLIKTPLYTFFFG
jgi:hypothetical protein